jgi:hypothetical protein
MLASPLGKVPSRPPKNLPKRPKQVLCGRRCCRAAARRPRKVPEIAPSRPATPGAPTDAQLTWSMGRRAVDMPGTVATARTKNDMERAPDARPKGPRRRWCAFGAHSVTLVGTCATAAAS